jgi:hypothetical protein
METFDCNKVAVDFWSYGPPDRDESPGMVRQQPVSGLSSRFDKKKPAAGANP